tara:strand:+ start:804 stop:1364 length:561 start_codon:yes stop_codon:yes gene_type:complete
MAATRTYPTQVIPANPAAADFETNFRSNTEGLMTATKDIDDEVSTARGTTYANVGARITALEGTAGVAASFWTVDSNASGSNGATSITVTGDATATYVVNRPIRIITSVGTQYGYVSSSSHNSGTTTVNLITNGSNTALTISGTVTSISYATMEEGFNWLVSYDRISSAARGTLSGSSVAMAIALG